MPISVRAVGPVRLGEEACGSDYRKIPAAAANCALSRVLLQLASLARHADDLFRDLADECQKLARRTGRVREKVTALEGKVPSLDSKEVPIPVGDLKKFSCIQDHHESKHGFECDMFTSETRPQCVQDLYNVAEASPSRIIKGCDNYRKDGLLGSIMFRLWPVAIRERNIPTPDLNLPRKNQPLRFNKPYKTLSIRNKTRIAHSYDELDFERNDANAETLTEQERLSQSQPSILVSIDTSGVGFERMCSFRRSLRERDDDSRTTSVRRRSISGLPESIMHEIKNFETRQKVSRGSIHRKEPRPYSFDDLEAEVKKDETLAKYFEEIDARNEEKSELVLKHSVLSRLIPCRRSKSLPRCMKSVRKSTEKRSVHRNKANCHPSLETTSSVSSPVSTKIIRSEKRASFIGDKIKLLTGTGQQPKSKPANLVSIEISPDEVTDEEMPNLVEAKTSSLPEGLSDISHSGRVVGPGSYYNFESNTLPRAQARKYDFPWESLPKDWTTSVKLREISKKRIKDERQSSSGNWSASTSARHSLESDQTKSAATLGVNSFTSQHSLGQDSGRDSATEAEDRITTDTTGYAGDETSTGGGDRSDMDSIQSDFTKLDTETWLKSLAVRAGSHDNTSSSSAETLGSLTKLSKHILALDLMSLTSRSRVPDEEELSVYSLDQEGFYTSFHTDSGLRCSNSTLTTKDNKTSQSSLSQISLGSSVTVDSVIYKPNAEKGKTSMMQTSPDLADSQISSVDSEASDSTLTTVSKQSTLNSNLDLSFSESDQEVAYARLKNKTQISSTMFPSLCTVSPSGSDEDENNTVEINVNGQQMKKEPKFSNSQKHAKQFNLKQSSKIQNKPRSYVNNSSNLSNKTSTKGSANFMGRFHESMAKEQTTSLANSLKETRELVSTDKWINSQKLSPDGNTLPRNYLMSKKWNSDQDQTSSWPRSNSWKDNKMPGILKSSQRTDSGPKAQKSLNFSPYVNLFEPDKPQVHQFLLSDVSSTDGSYTSLPEANSFTVASPLGSTPESSVVKSYKLYLPLNFSDSEQELPPATLPAKYLPSITVTPKSKTPPESQQSEKILSVPSHVNFIQRPKTPTPDSNKIVDNKSFTFVSRKESAEMKAVAQKDDVGLQVKPSSSLISTPYAVGNLTVKSKSILTSPTPKVTHPVATSQSNTHTGFSSFVISKPIVNKPVIVETVAISTTKTNQTLDHDVQPVAMSTFANPLKSESSSAASTPTATLEREGRFCRPSSLSLSGHGSTSANSDTLSSSTPHTPTGTVSSPSDSTSTLVSLSPSESPHPGSYEPAWDGEHQKSSFSHISYLPSRKRTASQAHSPANEEIKIGDYTSQIEDGFLAVNRNSSYRVAMEEEPENSSNLNSSRLDSYRIAINNSNKISDDLTSRSDSYRVAMQSLDTNNSTPEEPGLFYPAVGPPPGQDIRRMGITDVDQLKMSTEDIFMFSGKGSKSGSGNFFSKMQQTKQKWNKKNSNLSLGKSFAKLLKKNGKNSTNCASDNSNQSPLIPDKKKCLSGNPVTKHETSLQDFKNLVAQQTRSSLGISPKVSAKEALKKKPFDEDSSNKTGARFTGLFQRPASWGGMARVKPEASTYVSFDTIFEDKEDLSASSLESLRTPSIMSLKKMGREGFLRSKKSAPEKVSLVRSSSIESDTVQSEKTHVDEKAVQSVLDSIKTTIRSMTTKSERDQTETGV